MTKSPLKYQRKSTANFEFVPECAKTDLYQRSVCKIKQRVKHCIHYFRLDISNII